VNNKKAGLAPGLTVWAISAIDIEHGPAVVVALAFFRTGGANGGSADSSRLAYPDHFFTRERLK
jgi:hypothetical protein